MHPHSATAATPSVLTVSQLTNAIKGSLEKAFPHVWLQGEISNFKHQTSGHLYFSLKDPSAQISAVMFRQQAAALRIIPKDGAQVIIRGELNVYPPSGKYQIVVREMRHVGLGELLVKFEELKAKLLQRGWFNAEHKKPLPKFPKRIGVVTSPTGAAIQDILNVLTRRFTGFQLLLNPVKVQGEGSALEIAQAIRQFNDFQLADVIIVGRGGGSIEDLWAFNEEVVAEAIYNSRIPIISAVGHETDVCLSDFVADVRAPTPSAAAAMVIAEKEQQIHHLEQLRRRAAQAITHLLRRDRQQLTALAKHPLLSAPNALLGFWMQRHDDLKQQVDLAMQRSSARARHHLKSLQRQLYALRPTARIGQFRQRLEQWAARIKTAWRTKIDTRQHKLANAKGQLTLVWQAQQEIRRRSFSAPMLYKRLDQSISRTLALRKERTQKLAANLYSIDPKALLRKGYAILFREKKDSVITSISNVAPNDLLRIMLNDGEVLSTVKEILPK